MSLPAIPDYFYFATAANGLVPKSSQDGRASTVTETAELCVINARDVCTAFKNPTVVYSITKAVSITFVLGKVYYGIMLTTVELNTGAGVSPTLTFRGVENEGSNAVKTYSVTISLSPRSRAVDPLGAVTVPTGAKLVSCVTTWTADPVLVVQNNAIIASDIQHGRVDISASCVATSTSANPSAASGFDVRTARTETASDDSYRAVEIVATKTL